MKEPILKTPLRIYTAVWGDTHLELFEKTIYRSLSWKKNREALLNEDTTWSFHTRKQNVPKLVQLGKKLGVENFEITELSPEIDKPGADVGASLLTQFKEEIRRSLEDNSRVLIAPPDSIFGDGTITSLLRAGEQPETCVAVPHPRVTPSIFDYPSKLCESLNDELTNSELVTEAWNHLHRTWSQAEVGNNIINSYVGGVCWRRIKKGLYSVQHRLPTNYLCHFNQSDLQFFNQQIVFGAIDHLWPTKLIQEQRQRVLGSSDAAFIVEITDPKQNVPPAYPYLENEPDKFWRKVPHNAFFRQVNVMFRGVECD